MDSFVSEMNTLFETPADVAALSKILVVLDELIDDTVITKMECDRMLAVWITTRLTETEVQRPKDYDEAEGTLNNSGSPDYETGDGVTEDDAPDFFTGESPSNQEDVTTYEDRYDMERRWKNP